jgi:hypothetical protein
MIMCITHILLAACFRCPIDLPFTDKHVGATEYEDPDAYPRLFGHVCLMFQIK